MSIPTVTLVRALLGVVLLVLALGAWSAVRVFRIEYGSLRPTPSAVPIAEARPVVPNVAVVSFRSGATPLQGWFGRGTSDAAVVLVHGSGGTRRDVLQDMGVLSRAGFSVLAFDFPGHGESGGEAAWNEPERQSIRAALDWLGAQPGVNPQRIGAFGFSLGGYFLTQVASRDGRIRALALAGTPAELTDQARFEYGRQNPLLVWPALLAMHMAGLDPTDRVAEQEIRHFARPLLVIAGDKDPVVPPWLQRRLYEAASQPKAFYAVSDTEHGDYFARAGAAYENRLGEFFSKALRGDATGHFTQEGLPSAQEHDR